eukprot:g78.t1
MTELASGKKKKVKTTGPVEVVKEKDRSLKKEKKSKKTKVVAEQNQLDAKEEDLLLEELHDGRYPTSDEILDQMEQVPALHPPDVEAALNHEDLDQGSADPEAVSIKADDTKSKSASKKKKSSSKAKAEGMAVANDSEKIFKPSPSSAPAAAPVARKSKKKPAASPDAAAKTSNADVQSGKSATAADPKNAEARKETAETGEPAPPKKKNKQKKLKWAMVTISPADYQLRAIRAYESADEGQKKRICEINEKKYHMIRFFERKRIEKNLERARKEVMRMLKEQNVEGETKAREALAKVEADKKYVTKFPFSIPYLALFPNTDSPESEARRQYMREYIDKMVADKRAKFEDEEDKYLAAKADEKCGKGKGKGSKGKGKKGSGKGVQKGSEKKGKGKGAKGKGGKNDDSEKGSDDTEKAGVAAEQDKEGVEVVEEADGEAKPRKSEKKAKKQKKEAPSSSAAVAGVDAATEPAAKKEKKAKSKKRSAHDEAGEGATKGSAAKQGTEKAEKPTKVQRVDGDKKAAKQKQENGTHASFLASQAPHRQGAIVAANNTKKTFDDSDSD